VGRDRPADLVRRLARAIRVVRANADVVRTDRDTADGERGRAAYVTVAELRTIRFCALRTDDETHGATKVLSESIDQNRNSTPAGVRWGTIEVAVVAEVAQVKIDHLVVTAMRNAPQLKRTYI